jgi:hypothetical protein
MQIESMLRTHPQKIEDAGPLAVCIEACFACAQTCGACADACLAEPRRAELLRCIRLNTDCADLCEVTGRMLSRQTETEPRLVEDLTRLCALACRLCAEECARHAPHMEHCRVCEEACRACIEACEVLGAAVTH